MMKPQWLMYCVAAVLMAAPLGFVGCASEDVDIEAEDDARIVTPEGQSQPAGNTTVVVPQSSAPATTTTTETTRTTTRP